MRRTYAHAPSLNRETFAYFAKTLEDTFAFQRVNLLIALIPNLRALKQRQAIY